MSKTSATIDASVGVYAEQNKDEPDYINTSQEDYIEPRSAGDGTEQPSNNNARSKSLPNTLEPGKVGDNMTTSTTSAAASEVLLPLPPADLELPEKAFRTKTGSIYSKRNEIQYTVEDVPPWYLCIILGFQVQKPYIFKDVGKWGLGGDEGYSSICQFWIMADPVNPLWKFLHTALIFMHYLVMFGATVANPLVLAPALCIGADDQLTTSMLIGTIFVCSGLATLLQTTLGTRLPIVQGGTFTFVAPSFAILSLPHLQCPAANPVTSSPESADVTMAYDVNSTMMSLINGTTEDMLDVEEPLWKSRIREIQGAIMIASLVQVFIGFSGIMGFLLKWIGPLAIAPTISLAGLALFNVATGFASKQWWIALVTIILIAMFSQYTKNIAVPCFRFKKGQGCIKVNFPLFRLFPIILAIGITWIICLILTVAGVFSDVEGEAGFGANTQSRVGVFHEAPWFRLPYPGQWGLPTVSTAAVFGMLSGVLASMVESVGDYYACARIAQVPPPPMHAVNRGIGIEGLGCVLAGAFGSGTGTTSYSENIGAIGITKVASRRVIQTGAVIMLIMGMFGKFGALFVTIPDPIIGGVFIVMFGMITAVGISNLQFVDLNSSRNLFIIGFSFFFGLALPTYLTQYPNTIATGSLVVDQVVSVLLRTSMFVGGLAGFVLDNTIPGTDEERGLIKWRKQLIHKRKSRKTAEKENVKVANVYEIPFLTNILKRWSWTRYIPFFPTFDEELIDIKTKPKKTRKNKNKRRNGNGEDNVNGIEENTKV